MKEKMSDRGFKLMRFIMKAVDHFHPHVPQKAESFGIESGMTVVDYGCGPGRYTIEFAGLVGESGSVLAVDLVELALEETKRKTQQSGCNNVATYLAKGYDSGVPDKIADIVFAIDMFHYVQDTSVFLAELWRIAKDDGKLIISGGHQSRATIKRNLGKSDLWEICRENSSFIGCRKADQTS